MHTDTDGREGGQDGRERVPDVPAQGRQLRMHTDVDGREGVIRGWGCRWEGRGEKRVGGKDGKEGETWMGGKGCRMCRRRADSYRTRMGRMRGK